MNKKTIELRQLVTSLRRYRDAYAEDEYIPSEIGRLILIVQGRIYDIEEQENSE